MKLRKDTSVLEVAEKQCNQCLLTRNRIVPRARASEIIMQCVREERLFTCHKFQAEGRDVACRGFFNKFGSRLLVVRLARQLGVVREVRLESEG